MLGDREKLHRGANIRAESWRKNRYFLENGGKEIFIV